MDKATSLTSSNFMAEITLGLRKLPGKRAEPGKISLL
jgi:hypothetical protein